MSVGSKARAEFVYAPALVSNDCPKAAPIERIAVEFSVRCRVLIGVFGFLWGGRRCDRVAVRNMRAAVRAIWIATLLASLVFAQGGRKKNPVNGKWNATVGGQPYHFVIVEDQGDVTGTVTPAGKDPVEIEYGLIFDDELEFTTVEGGVEFEWTAKAGKNSIRGTRVNLDDESELRFSAKRAR